MATLQRTSTWTTWVVVLAVLALILLAGMLYIGQ